MSFLGLFGIPTIVFGNYSVRLFERWLRKKNPTTTFCVLSSFVCFRTVGKTVAITFDYAEDGLEKGVYAWSLEASSSGGEWLMIMMALGAVLTQYAIALELRLAYCGLQDANLDLQVRASNTCPVSHLWKLCSNPQKVLAACGTPAFEVLTITAARQYRRALGRPPPPMQ